MTCSCVATGGVAAGVGVGGVGVETAGADMGVGGGVDGLLALFVLGGSGVLETGVDASSMGSLECGEMGSGTMSGSGSMRSGSSKSALVGGVAEASSVRKF